MQPFAHNNAVSKQTDGTRVWVIPKPLARTLEVEGGEKPVVRFDAESRTIELDFATPDDTPGESLRSQSALDD
jgi:hypothetical protein